MRAYLLIAVPSATDIAAQHEAQRIVGAHPQRAVHPDIASITVSDPSDDTATATAVHVSSLLLERALSRYDVEQLLQDAGLTPSAGEGVHSGVEHLTHTLGFDWHGGSPQYVPIAVPATDIWTPSALDAQTAGRAVMSTASRYDDARAARDAMIRQAVVAGRTHAWCAEHFGVSRGRIPQITRNPGGTP